MQQFTAAPNHGGTYSNGANLSYPNYLPSRTGARNGTCSQMYCHSDGTGGGLKTGNMGKHPSCRLYGLSWRQCRDRGPCDGDREAPAH